MFKRPNRDDYNCNNDDDGGGGGNGDETRR